MAVNIANNIANNNNDNNNNNNNNNNNLLNANVASNNNNNNNVNDIEFEMPRFKRKKRQSIRPGELYTDVCRSQNNRNETSSQFQSSSYTKVNATDFQIDEQPFAIKEYKNQWISQQVSLGVMKALAEFMEKSQNKTKTVNEPREKLCLGGTRCSKMAERNFDTKDLAFSKPLKLLNGITVPHKVNTRYRRSEAANGGNRSLQDPIPSDNEDKFGQSSQLSDTIVKIIREHMRNFIHREPEAYVVTSMAPVSSMGHGNAPVSTMTAVSTMTSTVSSVATSVSSVPIGCGMVSLSGISDYGMVAVFIGGVVDVLPSPVGKVNEVVSFGVVAVTVFRVAEVASFVVVVDAIVKVVFGWSLAGEEDVTKLYLIILRYFTWFCFSPLVAYDFPKLLEQRKDETDTKYVQFIEKLINNFKVCFDVFVFGKQLLLFNQNPFLVTDITEYSVETKLACKWANGAKIQLELIDSQENVELKQVLCDCASGTFWSTEGSSANFLTLLRLAVQTLTIFGSAY
ncbi:probable serine/threonine-protein kinase MARK-A [Palaemon carinicauda]|uniref:probable serine/threonine-protein kinase MARK-A n=1 Tax=Palaemon carinicauda TaxID=392227 RepID=UPI0035B5EEC6